MGDIRVVNGKVEALDIVVKDAEVHVVVLTDQVLGLTIKLTRTGFEAGLIMRVWPVLWDRFVNTVFQIFLMSILFFSIFKLDLS